jgi:hypothetical protein
MNTRTVIAVVCAALLLNGPSALAAGGKKKTTPPPKPKLGSIGTTQMPGDNCKIGVAYTLGKDDALNVTLTGAEYKVTRVKCGDEWVWPTEEYKLLVIHYTIHNPLPRQQTVGNNVGWTAVTANGENTDERQCYLEENSAAVYQTLKPAQKIAVYLVFQVAAKADVQKLIMANALNPGTLVGRYDMRGKIKRIDPPYVDASDPSGIMPLQTFQGVMNTTYQIGGADVSVEKVEIGPDTIDSVEHFPVQQGSRYVLISLKVTNVFHDGVKWAQLKDTDGVEYTPSGTVLRASSLLSGADAPEPGATITQRRVYVVPSGVTLKSVLLTPSDSRPLSVDLAGFKVP